MKQKKIISISVFIGKFYEKHHKLPPLGHKLLKQISKKPEDIMEFLTFLGKGYPGAVCELVRLENDSDESTADDVDSGRTPKPIQMKASLVVHQRAQERMFQ